MLAAEVMAVIETLPDPVAAIVGSGVSPFLPMRSARCEYKVSVWSVPIKPVIEIAPAPELIEPLATTYNPAESAVPVPI